LGLPSTEKENKNKEGVGGRGRGWGQGGEMTQALYAHMNNKIKKKKETILTRYMSVKWLLKYAKNFFKSKEKD
jgi:hypothetical protein